MDRVRRLDDVLRHERVRIVGWEGLNPWPTGRLVTEGRDREACLKGETERQHGEA